MLDLDETFSKASLGYFEDPDKRAGMFLFELERLSGYRNILGKLY